MMVANRTNLIIAHRWRTSLCQGPEGSYHLHVGLDHSVQSHLISATRNRWIDSSSRLFHQRVETLQLSAWVIFLTNIGRVRKMIKVFMAIHLQALLGLVGVSSHLWRRIHLGSRSTNILTKSASCSSKTWISACHWICLWARSKCKILHSRVESWLTSPLRVKLRRCSPSVMLQVTMVKVLMASSLQWLAHRSVSQPRLSGIGYAWALKDQPLEERARMLVLRLRINRSAGWPSLKMKERTMSSRRLRSMLTRRQTKRMAVTKKKRVLLLPYLSTNRLV